MKELNLAFKRLKGTLRAFKNNKYAVNNDIDYVINVLEQMKIK